MVKYIVQLFDTQANLVYPQAIQYIIFKVANKILTYLFSEVATMIYISVLPLSAYS